VQQGAVTPGEPDPTGTGNSSIPVYPVTIAAGTSVARFDLVAGSPTNDDLDVYLFTASDLTEPVATSATGSAEERIDLDKPAAGNYVLLVNGFAAGDGSAEFTLRSFLVRSGGVGGVGLN
jgi:hypothetical protein